MRKVKRWRYYCDFCKKSGGSAGHMEKHEDHCTLNSDRKCRVCDLLDQGQPTIADMLAVLPDPEGHNWTTDVDHPHYIFTDTFLKIVGLAIDDLRKIAEGDWFDQNRLVVMKKIKAKTVKKGNGGGPQMSAPPIR